MVDEGQWKPIYSGLKTSIAAPKDVRGILSLLITQHATLINVSVQQLFIRHAVHGE